ncbi:MAG: thiamine phosphate synthase [Bacillota bacterium]|nr:thiamine phosphate synthase [Bacillota bacterium]
MEGLERLIDANINRASEGIRVLEDISRFYLDNAELTSKLKTLRHDTRKSMNTLAFEFVKYRDSDGDIGPAVSAKLNVEGKKDLKELIAANFKRAQEAARSIEETLKIMGMEELSRSYERIRYGLYSVEKEFVTGLKPKMRLNCLNTDIYCLTAEEYSLGRDNIEVVSRMLEAGIKLVQYREKDKTMLEKYRQCIKLRELTAAYGATFIVNDHIELARSVMADGVHLGQDDLPLETARHLVGNSMIIGVSTHSPDQAAKAIEGGADYIGVGPVFKTFTKKDVCDPVGFEYLDYAVKNVKIPFVAIGGIKLHNLGQVREHGAKCVALVTEIVGAEDIGAVIASARNIMKESVSNGI